MGGLSAAIRLARAGVRVTIFEQGERPGGKLNQWKRDGWTFDTGPSLLTMPWVLRDLFADAGASLDDHLTLDPVDPICRYFFADGTMLDLTTDSAAMAANIEALAPRDVPAFFRFLSYAADTVRNRRGALSPSCDRPGDAPARTARPLPLRISPARSDETALAADRPSDRLPLLLRSASPPGFRPLRDLQRLVAVPRTRRVLPHPIRGVRDRGMASARRHVPHRGGARRARHKPRRCDSLSTRRSMRSRRMRAA